MKKILENKNNSSFMLKNYTININNYSYFLDMIDAEQSAIL